MASVPKSFVTVRNTYVDTGEVDPQSKLVLSWYAGMNGGRLVYDGLELSSKSLEKINSIINGSIEFPASYSRVKVDIRDEARIWVASKSKFWVPVHLHSSRGRIYR